METYDGPGPDAQPCQKHLEVVRADTLSFGDRLCYFGESVRFVKDDPTDPMLRVSLIRRVGSSRERLALYRDDMVHVVRAGACRGEL